MNLDDVLTESPAAITCAECGMTDHELRNGWVSEFADTDATGEVPLRVFFCPSCAELDFD
jgi:hypothetical protein